jgi:hypothetical protein
MSPTELLERKQAQPFRPFIVLVQDGDRYEIRHPRQLMIGRDTVVIGLGGGDPEQSPFESIVHVDLGYIDRLEPLPEGEADKQ